MDYRGRKFGSSTPEHQGLGPREQRRSARQWILLVAVAAVVFTIGFRLFATSGSTNSLWMHATFIAGVSILLVWIIRVVVDFSALGDSEPARCGDAREEA